jgi:iron only hydrogenase large subunit-like protein
MHEGFPIYTEKTICQDCYRCVRNCPVKAIKIEGAVASVIDSNCIHCGNCVKVCPAGAKKVRNDRAILHSLLQNGERVIASVAPSYIAEFPELTPAALVVALKRIGFWGVSETALGAQEVSAHAAGLLETPGRTAPLLSSACPVVVKLICKYHPALAEQLTPLLSPLLAHCRMLKKQYPGVRVVFFGPCIAKKDEAAERPDLCDAALTFDDLRQLLADEPKLSVSTLPENETTGFIPKKADDGSLYPVDGGMVAGLKNFCSVTDCTAMHFSGIDEVASVIRSLEQGTFTGPVFLELLACSGGCINGPLSANAAGSLSKRLSVLNTARLHHGHRRHPSFDISSRFPAAPVGNPEFTSEAVAELLRSIGKHSEKDELNCGGCGYGNCRDFARAVLAGNAETDMCVTHMRQLALKKANKLISAIPLGIVIVNHDLTIVECNERFARLAGNDVLSVYQTVPGMQGASLGKVFPVVHLFRHVFTSGTDITARELRIGNRILRSHLFTIEPGMIAGGIFSDVTEPELKRDEIIERAQTVIRNNLTTVQKIAFLLGENAADTEMVLSSIIDSYRQPEENGDNRL